MSNKFLDSNGLLYLWNKIKVLLNEKVDKVEGKELSSNDFTDAEKTKLQELNNYILPSATATTLGGIKIGEGVNITDGVLSISSINWDNIQGKPNVALKDDITNVYRYKGSVSDFALLPSENNEIGDVYNVESTDMNYAWNGEAWDPLGSLLTVQSITNAEIDQIVSGE